MPRYVVLYKFTAEGAKNIRDTVKRARQTREQTEKRGFKIQALLWTQGPYDLVSIIEAPSEEAMMGAMANVVAAGNVSSTTMRAFDDKEMEGVLKQVLPRSSPARRSGAARWMHLFTEPRRIRAFKE